LATVGWSRIARNDLTSIEESIARTSTRYAERATRRINAAIERLATFPLLGRTLPELNNVRIRELIVGSYRVIYRVDEHDAFVTILGIAHAHRNLLRRIRGERWDIT
jgi:plasmid stabilization system protein ParE